MNLAEMMAYNDSQKGYGPAANNGGALDIFVNAMKAKQDEDRKQKNIQDQVKNISTMKAAFSSMPDQSSAGKAAALVSDPTKQSRVGSVDLTSPVLDQEVGVDKEGMPYSTFKMRNASVDEQNKRMQSRQIQIKMEQDQLRNEIGTGVITGQLPEQVLADKFVEAGFTNDQVTQIQQARQYHAAAVERAKAIQTQAQGNVIPSSAMMSLANGQAGDVQGTPIPMSKVDAPAPVPVQPMQDGGMIFSDTKDGRAVAINPDEVERKANAVLNGKLFPSQLPKFGGAASIYNKVTDKVLEKDPTFDLAGADQTYGATKGSLLQLRKLKTMVGAFERTAQKNANVLESLTASVDWRGQSPALNGLKQAFSMSVVQDPKLASAKTALTTFTTEYAKIMSGASGGAAVSDSARKESAELISLTDSPEAFKQRIAVMKQDMQNRKDGFIEEENALRGLIGEETTGTEQLQAQGAQGGAPAVGGMFNGEKVISVKRIR